LANKGFIPGSLKAHKWHLPAMQGLILIRVKLYADPSEIKAHEKLPPFKA